MGSLSLSASPGRLRKALAGLHSSSLRPRLREDPSVEICVPWSTDLSYVCLFVFWPTTYLKKMKSLRVAAKLYAHIYSEMACFKDVPWSVGHNGKNQSQTQGPLASSSYCFWAAAAGLVWGGAMRPGAGRSALTTGLLCTSGADWLHSIHWASWGLFYCYVNGNNTTA